MRTEQAFSIPRGLFNWSLFLTVAAFLLFAPYREALPLIPWLADLLYYFDIVQGVTFLAVLGLLSMWVWTLKPGNVKLLAFTLGFVLIMFVLEMRVVGDSFGVAFFGLKRPLSPLQEPPLTAWIKRFENPSVYNSAPSDFIFRQWVILLLGFLVLDQPQLEFRQKRISNSLRALLKIVFSASLCYVTAGRLFRLAHAPIDVAISFALGSICFWGVTILVGVFSGVSIDPYVESGYTMLCLFSVSFFIFLSASPVRWIYVIIAFPIASWLAMWFSQKLRTRILIGAKSGGP